MIKKITLDEYKEFVFSTYRKLIDITTSLNRLENIRTKLLYHKRYISIIINEKINILIDKINKKIEK